ncbi:sigma-54 dependent transcriptional regulator [Myxococcota bacterium]|nr:sigma-54 dependent transcriptional regulator [Myxococcota bacterium]
MQTDATPRRILVVDDDEHLRKFLTRGLSRIGFQTVAADSGSSGIALLREQSFDCVVCDLHMPDVDGLDVLRFAAELSPRPPFIVLTGYGSVSVAVEAMKRGASDFLEKPVGIDDLRATIQAVLSRPRAPSVAPPSKPTRTEAKGLVGVPAWLDPFLDQLRRIAQTDSTVLLEGETGTGKSVIAREIAKWSSRASGPCIEVNCAAIPDQLLENELFGHVQGAFTGAVGQPGRVELAAGGTLFLDEIGDLKEQMQAKLLQLLQERIFTPVGASKPKRADVRFIAATNRDLAKDVEAGRFRADLYYRLNVVSLMIPPLRDRAEDIPLLVDRFRHRIAERISAEPPIFGDDVLRLLVRYRWPGNVRELENLVERMVVMHPGKVIVPSMLPARFADADAKGTETRSDTPSPVIDATAPSQAPVSGAVSGSTTLPPGGLEEEVKRVEILMIRNALTETRGNKSAAARKLNMNRTTLIEKIRRLGAEHFNDLGAEPPSNA